MWKKNRKDIYSNDIIIQKGEDAFEIIYIITKKKNDDKILIYTYTLYTQGYLVNNNEKKMRYYRWSMWWRWWHKK